MPMRALIDLPTIEYLDGEAYPKVSPRFTHARVQARLTAILVAAAGTRGWVGTELDVLPGAVDGTKTAFVPDLAFLSSERLAALNAADREEPPFSPDIAVEIWSPSNERRYLDRKIAKYLATGALVVLDVNPYDRTIVAHDPRSVRRFDAGETFEHAAVPWLGFQVAEAFQDLDR
jgi:Uma2 family endonuclease